MSFRSTCAECGQVLVDPGKVSVVLTEDGTAYECACPRCLALVHVDASPATVEMLLSLGAGLSLAVPDAPVMPRQ